ncbi:MAG: glycosyltransferase family 2 protein [Verrucomicrobiales bacterium]
MSNGPAVTICIPAWQAEDFIEKTLDCATSQDYENIRILVSIDQSNDATAEICRRYAARDNRLSVHVHEERLGWVGNVNFLLDLVETELFFIYFHDDIILPAYISRLVLELQDHPEAGSVHCDMGHFGATEHVSVGRANTGCCAQRMAEFLIVPERGSPLRSITRTSLLKQGLRLPRLVSGGLWANEPYLLHLMALGTALHVPEVLYMRWNRRKGGLTDGWRAFSAEDFLGAYRGNVEASLQVIRSVSLQDWEQEALVFCLYLASLKHLWAECQSRGAVGRIRPEEVSPAFQNLTLPQHLGRFTGDVEQWILRRAKEMEESLNASGTIQ